MSGNTPPSLADLYRSVLGECLNHQHKQVGRCVYCADCNWRLYQGTVMSEREIQAVRDLLAAEEEP